MLHFYLSSASQLYLQKKNTYINEEICRPTLMYIFHTRPVSQQSF